MAQAATMGPPLSPRETRRSGRRSLHSASASTSKSPDSETPPKQKDSAHRPPPPSNNTGGRQKRLKQEDLEEPVDDRKNLSAPPATSTTNSNNSQTSGRNKRKQKDKEKQLVPEVPAPPDAFPDPGEAPAQTMADEEEEQGITRCVCGSADDDPDAGEFMVQCETCKVWQHGLCMGFESEDQLHDDDYYCEQCKPELHTDLLRKRAKRPRQSSALSHHNPTSTNSRVSRSHSPSTLLKQPSKRRNTMNSRDAAFDESLKEIIEATAAEAAAAHDASSVASNGNRDCAQPPDEDIDSGQPNRKKRKRSEDDTAVKKRTRSASTTSEQPTAGTRDATISQTKTPTLPPPPPKATGRSNKRGGRKAAAPPFDQHALDGEDVAKRPYANSRAKGSGGAKRPPASTTAASNDPSRRNQPNATSGTNVTSAAENSRSYRNSHAYAVSQQTLYTSWNLPDYLAHLEPMLPTQTPQPLEVRSGVSDSVEERGVKVKWPGKRMSVGDMNKRVRSLVEWVGREQATALDRMRRREALTVALREQMKNQSSQNSGERQNEGNGRMAHPTGGSETNQVLNGEKLEKPVDESTFAYESSISQSAATMKMMEELMEELIGFQERFGPGARSRERRIASS